MRRTPPVVVHVQPQPAVQAVVALIVTLAGVGLACWAISHEAWAWPALLAVPALAVYAWREAAASPRRLRWDGEAWWLAEPDQQEETAVRLAVLIDLDAWLLLRPSRPMLAAAVAPPAAAVGCAAGDAVRRAGRRRAAMSAPAQDADALLVREAQAGSRVAFDMLVLKYQRRIERLLSRSVRDPADVADLCQETFLSAYRALPAFRGESAFYTWIYRIAINAAQRHRGRQRDVQSLDDDEGTFVTDAHPTDDASPEALLAGRQLAQGLDRAVAALAEDQRRALLLREVDGLSYDEIADLMDCPPGTVRSRIFRAREAVASKLRELLGGGGRPW